jgi:DNA-binding NarL/FixJ family response regulator
MDTAIRAIVPSHGPTAGLLVGDDRRRRQLESVLDPATDGQADVLVIDLPAGAILPAELPAVPVLLLSDDPGAVEAGTAGLLPRDATARQIVAAVGALAEGLHVRLPAPRPPSPLTPRESEILALIAEGMSNKAIARRLGISAHTVKYHLEAVFAKLAVNSRAEALSRGLRRGLVAL